MNKIVEKKRDLSFDIAKGIGMLAVILGHMSLLARLSGFIFSFHMPLFFLINGYFFKEKDSWVCIRKKARSLILPYVCTCILVILSSVFWNIIKGADLNTVTADIKMWTLASLYGSGTITHFLKWNFHIIGAIWFLLAVFWADVIFNFLLKTKHKYILGFILAAIGYFTTDLIWLPASFQAGLTSILFIEIGYFIKQKNLFEKCINNIWVLIAAAILWGNSIINGGQLYMVRNFYGDGIFDILGAIGATFIILKFSRFLAKTVKPLAGLLAKYGKDSLIVLCFHLVELNTFPWYIISNNLGYISATIIIFCMKVLWSVWCVFVVKYIPVLNVIFNKHPKEKL